MPELEALSAFSLSNFEWLRPYFLWAIPVAFLVFYLGKSVLEQDRFWESRLSTEMATLLLTSNKKKSIGLLWLFLVFWITLVISLAGPSWKKINLPTVQSKDALFIVLDASLSMLATDASPSRFDLAKFRIIDLLRLRNDGSSSLIVYAGSAHIVAPLTDDVNTIINQLNALSPTIMPKLGSEPDKAFELVLSMSKENAGAGKILWFTDEASENDITMANALISDSDLRLIIIPTGTQEGAPVPLPSGFLTNPSGGNVIARVPLKNMKRIAQNIGADFIPLAHFNDTLMKQLVDETGAFAKPNDSNQASSQQPLDSGYLLAPLLLLLLLPMFRRGVLFALVLTSFIPDSRADGFWKRPDQQGYEAFTNKDFDSASKTFENKSWEASSLYRLGKYDSAAKIWTSMKDWYNAGNALAKKGSFPEAIEAYEKAIAEDSENEDAKFNLELLKQAQQQQDQQQQDQQQQDQQQQDQQQQDQQQQDQQQQDQQQQDQQQQDQQQQDQQQQDQQQQDQQQQDQQQQDEGEQDEGEQDGDEQDAEQDAEQDPEESEEKTAEELLEEKKQEAARQEAAQIYEQWLRKIPNDPSLLLKRKFLHQYNQRRGQLDEGSSNGKAW